LIKKGISVQRILASDIFTMYFDFDEWPAVHGCSDEAMKPYNGNVFLLRSKYGLIFKEKKLRSMDASESGSE
tara:strand:+ start:153 stop:368 length:216 start_codon:yes stop_codon:yes gene_type:complete